MNNGSIADNTPPMDACMRIRVILPDDGTELLLLKALRREQGLTRVDSLTVRAVAALEEAKTRGGQLPESTFAKVVTVIVNESAADALFDSIYETARIGRPGGGMILMQRLLGATRFALPDGIPEEAD